EWSSSLSPAPDAHRERAVFVRIVFGAHGRQNGRVAAPATCLGSIVEYLHDGKLTPGLVVREQGEKLTVADGQGTERAINRELVLMRHSEARPTADNLAEVIEALMAERARLSAELDLNLLWEVVREQG